MKQESMNGNPFVSEENLKGVEKQVKNKDNINNDTKISKIEDETEDLTPSKKSTSTNLFIKRKIMNTETTFGQKIKSFLWGLFKLFYILLGTVAIIFIIWYFGSNYYYSLGFYAGQQATKKAVIYDLIEASKSCKVITIGTKKDKNITRLINVDCLKNIAPASSQTNLDNKNNQTNKTTQTEQSK